LKLLERLNFLIWHILIGRVTRSNVSLHPFCFSTLLVQAIRSRRNAATRYLVPGTTRVRSYRTTV